MADRPGMKVGEKEHHVQYDMLQVGTPAPDFELTGTDFKTRRLSDYDGKVKILSVIPSIATGVCATQTRRFNEEAANLSDDIVVLTISADFPLALKSFCGNEGIDRTETLSTYRDMNFADDYGVHDTDWRMCQRSVFVLDRDNAIRHTQYMPVMGHEVDFDAALNKAKELV